MFFVRTATEGDLEKVRRLLCETWHATYDAIYGAVKVEQITSQWHSPAALKARLERRDGEFLVADDGRQIGGMAFAAMAPNMAKTAMLHQLYVHPSFQRQGIGRDLFAELETCFPDAEVMRLEVEPQNSGAIAFYTAHGFVEVDRIDNCGGEANGIPVLVMEKPLV
ncbi:GNAT family N-acetyltransferase [Rhizobium paknamense]|uniref:Ribosomal protein S18 acetylase RimI-like enzyme n=1 Tax=Rhizobium paknamense TaxID=1206817 RepID=A0ABU0I6W0_9HYPH|nr:GNAT family N-acetyltransferase [Rhizobium paknamense]MDQ0453970.1 ribosomal protein S18 acetylase RimI-like enzyme [Rhizobium paknamense]